MLSLFNSEYTSNPILLFNVIPSLIFIIKKINFSIFIS